ncbi:MAG: GDSL-type esterase/lipase family protein [Pseudomonadota bacterium]|nr:GDSL-type esterase/lipase family protein [Pseudomonadota bacterium]
MVTGKRLYLFYAFALSIPLLFFVLIETGLRVFDYGADQRLFIPAAKETGNEAYLMTNPEVAYRYFPSPGYAPQPPEELFRQQKPENSYRIFVMGGSSAATWPYPGNVLFSRLLSQRLADAFPDKYIEVINTGIAAVNTFTLLDFMAEIVAQKPDAILIYAGHNEFYGALGAASSNSVGQSRWIITTYLKLLHLKTVQLIRNTINTSTHLFKATSTEQYATLMGRMIGDRSVAYDSPTYQAAKANYEANLREILTLAKTAGVPVVLSELVSNLRDQKPFVSVDDGAHLPADIAYAWAQQLEQQQMYGLAKETYSWAKDLDGLRFRAPEEFNNVIQKVAAEFNAPVVPMRAYFEKESANGIIGNSLMLEHLHPNVEGYLLMSEAFFDTLHENRFISETWNEQNILPAALYRRAWPITDFDRALGEIRIIGLTDHWPYPPKGQGERTIANFKPHSKAEELAYRHFKDEISYFDGHIQLAQFYEAEGKPALAMREYNALISASPYNITSYFPAIQALLAQKNYDQVLPLLFATKNIRENSESNRWIGQIYMYQGRPPQEIEPFLDMALILKPDDTQTLFNLAAVKLSSNELEGARHYIGLLEEHNADPAKIAILQQQLAQQERSISPMPPLSR